MRYESCEKAGENAESRLLDRVLLSNKTSGSPFLSTSERHNPDINRVMAVATNAIPHPDRADQPNSGNSSHLPKRAEETPAHTDCPRMFISQRLNNGFHKLHRRGFFLIDYVCLRGGLSATDPVDLRPSVPTKWQLLETKPTKSFALLLIPHDII